MTAHGSESLRSVDRSEWFHTTCWTTVVDACKRSTEESNVSLGRLCETYWYPLYTFIRRSGHSPEDAADLTQGFFLRLIQKDFLTTVDRKKGKFRSFLLVALKRFMANEWASANRIKRGGGQRIISLSLDDTEARYSAEPVDHLSPEKAFEKQWALSLLQHVVTTLEAEYVKNGKAAFFGAVKIFISGDNASYAEIATKIAMKEPALRVAVHRLRQRYRDLLRWEIGKTVESNADIDREVRYLFDALA